MGRARPGRRAERGPGGLRTEVADIRRVQRQHGGLLGALNRDVAGVKRV